MNRVLLSLLLAVSCCMVHAQTKTRGIISGKIFDSLAKSALPDATIAIMNPADSTAAGFAVSDKQGEFVIRNVAQGNYLLTVSYIGFMEYSRKIQITAAHTKVEMGTVLLQTDTSTLQGVVVTQAPILIKKDTIEFKAGAFKTKINGTIEDLLKKLPGVEVDKDGNIVAQGNRIIKLYVDGKEFFSNDPRLATKNLTADLVESVQIFDDMSDHAKFTKMDDGSRQRAINIKLKKDKKNGMFGRAIVGAGSDERYQSNVSFNSFGSKSQLSILGGANNVSKLGFSSANAGGGSNSNARGGGAPDGNTTSWNSGVNFRDQWGTKWQFSGNYLITKTNTTTESNNYSQNFFPNDSVSYTNQHSYNNSKTLNHQFNGRLEYTIDDKNSISITPTLNLQHFDLFTSDSIKTRATNPKADYTAIAGNNQQSGNQDLLSFTNNFLYKHRFKKDGQTLGVTWITDAGHNNGNNYNLAPYTFYDNDTTSRFQDRRQQNGQSAYHFNNTISSFFTKAFGKDKLLELTYAYVTNYSTSDKRTFDYSNVSGKYDSVNKPLTNYFKNTFTSNYVGSNFRVKKQKYDFQLGGAVQFAELGSVSYRAISDKDSTTKQRFTNFFPNASFNYNLGTKRSLRFSYRGGTKAPTVAQLQDVVDISNPLNYRTGNPNLKQEFDNSFNFSYNTFNLGNFMFFNANVIAGVVGNKIVNGIDTINTKSVNVLDTLNQEVLLTKPVNLNGAWNLTFSGTVGIPLKKVASGKRSPMNINLTTSLGYNKDVSILYKAINYTYSTIANERINFNYNIENKFDLNANVNLTYNNTMYSIQSNQNNKYFSHNYTLDLDYTFLKNYSIASDFTYFINTGRASGFNQSVPLWNMSAAMLLFKKHNGELRISVYDILNQNKSINRTIGENYIRDTYTQVLQRFFMVSFMYNLNRFTGKQLNKNNNAGNKF